MQNPLLPTYREHLKLIDLTFVLTICLSCIFARIQPNVFWRAVVLFENYFKICLLIYLKIVFFGHIQNSWYHRHMCSLVQVQTVRCKVHNLYRHRLTSATVCSPRQQQVLSSNSPCPRFNHPGFSPGKAYYSALHQISESSSYQGTLC